MRLKKFLPFILLSSQVAFAGGMGTVKEVVPDYKWEIGGEVLYFRPSLTNFSYIGFTDLGLNGSRNAQQYFRQRMAWGGRLEGAWFYDVGSELRLYWSSFNNSTRDNFAIDFDSNNGVPNDAITTRGSVKWNDVVLSLGQLLTFDHKKSVRFSGGLEYSSIDTTRTLNTSNAFGTSSNYTTHKYNGVGPLLSLDMFYDVVDWLQLYAKGNASALLGSSKYTSTTTFSTNNTNPISSANLNQAVVPTLGIDIGGNVMFDTQSGTLKFDAGWRFKEYFDAFYNANISVFSAPGVSANFSVQGPYFGVKWMA